MVGVNKKKCRLVEGQRTINFSRSRTLFISIIGSCLCFAASVAWSLGR